MASSLAAQLSQIAANSTNSLNIKAQKAAHGQSLIFEPRVAASQSFDTIYTLCHEGFQELCLLDGRFLEFQRDIFSEQSQEQDRTQMTAAQNAELDKRLEAFLGLVGGRLRLSPAVKAVEWLIRRFRIHEQNTSFLLTTFLPYHILPLFTTLLSILPSNLPPQYKFLHPYIRSLTQLPRHAIVNTAIISPPFSSLFNAYVLHICNKRQQYPALLSFWAGVMTEAVSGMLEKSRSGRQGVQLQNEQDVILRLLPTLNEGLAMKKVPDLRIGCYMLLSIMASKGDLEDKLLIALMEAVVTGWTSDTFTPGLVCLSILAQRRGAKQITKRLTKELLKVGHLSNLIVEIAKQRRVDKLANGLCLALIDRLSKNGNATSLAIVENVVRNGLLSDAQTSVVVKALLLTAYRLDDSVDANGSARSQLARTLNTLASQTDNTGSLVRGAIDDASIDMDELEMKLQAVIRPKAITARADEDTVMKDSDHEAVTSSVSFGTLFSTLPVKTVDELSFLSHSKSHIYDQLSQAFLVAVANTDDLQKFDHAPILRREDATTDTLYFSFFMRSWCSPQPVLARVAALHMVTSRLKSVHRSTVDIQALVPYAAVALSDPATRVRRAAAELILTINTLYPTEGDVKKQQAAMMQWGSNELYGHDKETKTVKWLSVDHAARFLRDVLMPVLEECVLDRTHLDSVLDQALNSPKNPLETPNKNDSSRLSQTLRLSILAFLSSHVINTPLYLVKLRLLAALNRVRGVASTSRTKLLLPVLQQWALLMPAQAHKHSQDEQIELEKLDDEIVTVVVANDAEGLQCMEKIVNGEIASDRPTLVAAVFRRIRKMWPSLKGDTRISTAQLLLDLSQRPAGEVGSMAKGEAMDLLRTVTLSTDILLSFLNQLPTTAKLADTPPASKRRRVSHGEVARASIQDSNSLTGAVQKVTFVLQLIDSSNPEEHTSLLAGLFNTLAELQHFKTHVGSELGYLQGLVLSSLLAIMEAYKADRKLKLNRTAVRADLLVDCVQKTASPQVQNSALLMIASLAETAPELVLHSVMPIFTFMGSSVLRQNDEYSAHVIKQTINKVIPPLIESLRQEKGNPVTGAAELLLSFVAAYEHVPAHRRKALFTSLVRTLGPEDFLFALLAMLADKYGVTADIKAFTADLSGAFSIDVQLQTGVKYLDLISDVLKPKPAISSMLLSTSDKSVKDPHRIVLTQLSLLAHLLSQRKLIHQMGKLLEHDDMDSSRIRDLYSSLLENILALADSLKNDKRLHGACGDVLESLLGLLSTSEFVKSVEGLLYRPNEDLRRKILRSLEVRIDQEKQSDPQSRSAMLNFLPQLTAIIRESEDVLYKRIAVGCVGKISEKYGKKDLEAVAAAAQTIASNHCLGQEDERLRAMALLCLASLVEILREGIVPVLPVAITKALDYMEESVEEEKEDTKLHNAGYAFISALAEYLPYMISIAYLNRLLKISNDSAESELDEEAEGSRTLCLQLAAKQIEAKTLFTSLEQGWHDAADSGSLALREYLNVLSTAIDTHPKSAVTKSSAILSSIFLKAFDLRRQWTLAPDDEYPIDTLDDVESSVNSVAIKMIYKFNDTTFRPIFSKLIEWASSGLPKKDKAGRIFRLQSVYSFLAVFFDSLKSIVTSYSTYLIDNVVEILQNVDVKDDESKELWRRALKTLVECFKHDQDDFWQSPAHFDAIAPTLTAQFLHASNLPLVEELIPAIVELAAAADSADHHKELNGTILKHMRSESASIRLAAVRCGQALTDRLGEEWLSMLPEMLPFISELQEDDDEIVEKETHRWIVKIEGVLGESLDSMLQ